MEIKYTKFSRNKKNFGDYKVWSYAAYDELEGRTLVIKLELCFTSDLPCEIHVGTGTQYDVAHLTNLISEEITAKEFWAAYKLYVTRLYQYMLTHNSVVSQSVEIV